MKVLRTVEKCNKGKIKNPSHATFPYSFQLLYDEFLRDPSYLWIDDVFVTGVLAKRAKVRHKSMSSAFALLTR